MPTFVYVVMRYVRDRNGDPLVGQLNDVIGAYLTETEAKRVRDFMKANVSTIGLYEWRCTYVIRTIVLGEIKFEAMSLQNKKIEP